MSQVTTNELKEYSNAHPESDLLQQLYIDAAENVVEIYLNKALTEFVTMPGLVKLTILRIAALMQTESDGNIGITSKQFGESGNRTFIKTTDYSPYLDQIASYKKV